MKRPSLWAVRHRTPLTLAVFAAAFAASLWIQWVYLLQEACRSAEITAQHLTEVFQRHLESGLLLDQLLDDLDDSRTYAFLLETARHHSADLGLEKVKFYDLDGRIIFSEDRALVGEEHAHKETFQAARRGLTASKIVRPQQYTNTYGVPQFSSVVETYTPIFGANHQITHVMEVYKNFDPDLTRAHRFLGWAGAHLALVLGIAAIVVALLQRRVVNLEHEVDALESFLPICAYCKRIRHEEPGRPDRWVPVDHYLQEQEMASFSHGICDDCLKEYFPDDS